MNKYTLTIPSKLTDVNWFNFINSTLEDLDTEITHLTVDFTTVRFLETDDFVVLACLIESFCNENCTVEFTGGTIAFNSHLENIKFKNYWSTDFKRENFTFSRNKSTFCLWKVSRSMIDSYSEKAKMYFANINGDKDLTALSMNLKEVFNNIFDHAHSPVSGYVMIQYFPRINKLSFSVCDFGIGIPRSINNAEIKKGKPEVADIEAIVLALKRGHTSGARPGNRGWGLANILDFTKFGKGKLTIISNNIAFEKEHNSGYMFMECPYFFNGTLIRADVDLSTFEDRDDTEEVFDFENL